MQIVFAFVGTPTSLSLRFVKIWNQLGMEESFDTSDL